MKPLFSSLKPLLAVVLFFAASCNNEGDENANKDSSAKNVNVTNTSNTGNTNSTGSTIVTTPQNAVSITHKVTDFNKWMMAYEAHDSARLANGIHNYVVGRSATDSNTVFIALRADDMNKAKTFTKDPSLKQVMQNAGVIGAPAMNFTTLVWQDTATISTDMRARMTFTVKDWSNWQKAFDSGKQVRMDNGMVDRVYGHDADDDHNVTLVFAITDTAKANAFWMSDQIKKIRTASGVISQPQRFLYRIVKRY